MCVCVCVCVCEEKDDLRPALLRQWQTLALGGRLEVRGRRHAAALTLALALGDRHHRAGPAMTTMANIHLSSLPLSAILCREPTKSGKDRTARAPSKLQRVMPSRLSSSETLEEGQKRWMDGWMDGRTDRRIDAVFPGQPRGIHTFSRPSACLGTAFVCL